MATITSGNVNKYLRGTRLEAYQTPDESGMYTSGVSYGIIRTMPFDENGNTSELDYDLLGYTAFGKYQLNSANTNSVNPFGYNGEVTDTDTGTGLIYLRNRYYDPEIGRFLTVDPAMDGTNWYSYCNNDPVNFEDPWGMEYDSLRNLMFDYMGAFDGEYSLNFSELNGKGYAYVTLGKYERAFYYDGTIIDRQYDEYGECTETTTKVADNIDGTLYMERSAFVAAMGMTKDGTATVKYTEPVYVSKSMSTVDFIDHIIASYSFTGDVENVINLVSKVPIGNEIKIAVTAGKLISDIGNNTMLSMGYYQYEVVSVQSPYREWYSHKTTTLYGIENDTKYYQNVNKYGGIYGIYFGQ